MVTKKAKPKDLEEEIADLKARVLRLEHGQLPSKEELNKREEKDG